MLPRGEGRCGAGGVTGCRSWECLKGCVSPGAGDTEHRGHGVLGTGDSGTWRHRTDLGTHQGPGEGPRAVASRHVAGPEGGSR